MGDGIKRRPAQGDALVAAAQVLNANRVDPQTIITQTMETQQEAWNFYHSLGELQFAIGTWYAGSMSRVKLIPAIHRLGEDPTPVTDDDTSPAANLLRQTILELGSNLGGVAEMMSTWAVHLSVPGESYLVGTQDPLTNLRHWKIYSNSEIQSRGRDKQEDGSYIYRFVVNDARGVWDYLPLDSLVCRIWNPDEQFSYLAFSNAQGALPIMREIDMYNRYIVAILISRIALNGILLVPSEVTFPAKEQFKDEADPFMAELMDIATAAIKNPGSAAAALPLFLKVPAQYIEQFRHMTFDTEISKDLMVNREAAIRRLSVAMNVPAEVMDGLANMNHWGQWQLEESAVKLYISPGAEMIVNGLMEGLVRPIFLAQGTMLTAPNNGTYCVWYDASALVQQPDASTKAQAVYDEGGLSEEAFVRESGFEPEDMPKIEQFKIIALKKIALGAGASAMAALAALTGDESLVPPPPAPPVDDSTDGTSPAPADDSTGGSTPPTPAKPVVKGPPSTKPAS